MYVDPSGFVVAQGRKYPGRGAAPYHDELGSRLTFSSAPPRPEFFTLLAAVRAAYDALTPEKLAAIDDAQRQMKD